VRCKRWYLAIGHFLGGDGADAAGGGVNVVTKLRTSFTVRQLMTGLEPGQAKAKPCVPCGMHHARGLGAFRTR
jgi:hypothetical protein